MFDVILRASVTLFTMILAYICVSRGGRSSYWIMFTGHVLAEKNLCWKSVAFPLGLVTWLSLLSRIARKRLVFLPLQIAVMCQMFSALWAS